MVLREPPGGAEQRPRRPGPRCRRIRAVRSRRTSVADGPSVIVEVINLDGDGDERIATGTGGVEPRSAERRTSERRKSAEPRSAEQRRSARPRSAEPRSARPRSAEPRSAEPRSAERKSSDRRKSGEEAQAQAHVTPAKVDQKEQQISPQSVHNIWNGDHCYLRLRPVDSTTPAPANGGHDHDEDRSDGATIDESSVAEEDVQVSEDAADEVVAAGPEAEISEPDVVCSAPAEEHAGAESGDSSEPADAEGGGVTVEPCEQGGEADVEFGLQDGESDARLREVDVEMSAVASPPPSEAHGDVAVPGADVAVPGADVAVPGADVAVPGADVEPPRESEGSGTLEAAAAAAVGESALEEDVVGDPARDAVEALAVGDDVTVKVEVDGDKVTVMEEDVSDEVKVVEEVMPRGRPCLICSQRFATTALFRQHMLDRHLRAKPYTCMVCWKSFYTGDDINRHTEFNCLVTYCKCQRCDLVWSSESWDSQSCPKCSKDPKNLKKAGEKPYECGVCGEGFILPRHLATHVKKHSGDDTVLAFKCNKCGKRFQSQLRLIVHIKHHKDMLPHKNKGPPVELAEVAAKRARIDHGDLPVVTSPPPPTTPVPCNGGMPTLTAVRPPTEGHDGVAGSILQGLLDSAAPQLSPKEEQSEETAAVLVKQEETQPIGEVNGTGQTTPLPSPEYASDNSSSQQEGFAGFQSDARSSQQEGLAGFQSDARSSQQEGLAGFQSDARSSQQEGFAGFQSDARSSQQEGFAGFQSDARSSQQEGFAGFQSDARSSQQEGFAGFQSDARSSQQEGFAGFQSDARLSQQEGFAGFQSDARSSPDWAKPFEQELSPKVLLVTPSQRKYMNPIGRQCILPASRGSEPERAVVSLQPAAPPAEPDVYVKAEVEGENGIHWTANSATLLKGLEELCRGIDPITVTRRLSACLEERKPEERKPDERKPDERKPKEPKAQNTDDGGSDSFVDVDSDDSILEISPPPPVRRKSAAGTRISHVQKIPPPAPKSKFQCEICFKTFPWISHLECHLRTHTGDRPFTCGVCMKDFKQMAHVSQHIKTHNFGEPFLLRWQARQHGEKGTKRILNVVFGNKDKKPVPVPLGMKKQTTTSPCDSPCKKSFLKPVSLKKTAPKVVSSRLTKGKSKHSPATSNAQAKLAFVNVGLHSKQVPASVNVAYRPR